MRPRTALRWLACAWSAAGLSMFSGAAGAADIDEALKTGERTQRAAASSQKRIDSLSDDTELLVTKPGHTAKWVKLDHVKFDGEPVAVS